MTPAHAAQVKSLKNVMVNKLLIWAVSLFLISGFGWFVSIIINIVTLGSFRDLSNILGVLAGVSFVLAIILSIVKLVRKCKKIH